jgi:hypothetical protein
MALAADYGIEEYPSPGGGCLLTKAGFADRLRDLLATHENVGLQEVELLKWGRHLRLPSGRRLVVGRIHADNLKLQELANGEDLLLRVEGVPTPTGLLSAESSQQELELAAKIVAAYSDSETGEEATVEVSGKETREIEVKTPPKEEFRELLI